MPAKSNTKVFRGLLDYSEDPDVFAAIVHLALVLETEPNYDCRAELEEYLKKRDVFSIIKKVLSSAALSSVDLLEAYLANMLERVSNQVSEGEGNEKWLLDMAEHLKQVNTNREKLVATHRALEICHEAKICIEQGFKIELIFYSKAKMHRAFDTYKAIVNGLVKC